MTGHVADYKKEIVKNLANLISHYHIVGIVNMENMPAKQLQNMRKHLRKNAVLTMTKRRLMHIAFQQAKTEKSGIEKLCEYLSGMPALLFTNENPFKLSKILNESKSPAPAKPNQIAPRDIIINKGPTSFAPGPFIAELSMAGVKAGVESGKIAIKESAVVAKKGEKIKPKVAEILVRLGIHPMEVGLGLVAVYENGLVYTSDILFIDEGEYINRIARAERGAFNLAMSAHYPTKETVKLLIANAQNSAIALGTSQNIFDKGIVELLVGKAYNQMKGLSLTANIQIDATFKPVEKAEEKKIEEKKEEQKEMAKKHEIRVLTMKELEENIKKRDKEREMREIEQITKEIVKKHALEK